MTTPYKSTHHKAAKLARLQCDIDAEAMQLLQEECILSPRGRHLGLARAINKCVYAYLGGKKIFQERQES